MGELMMCMVRSGKVRVLIPKCEPCFTHLNFYLSELHDLLNEVAAGGKAGGRGGVCL